MSNASQETQCPQCRSHVQYPASTTTGEEVRYCPTCRLPLVHVAGKYKLERELSEGGCGILYLARHVRLNMEPIRVVKFLKPELFEKANAGKRFAYEVELTSALSQRNDHIVRIYDDFGELDKLGHYYVMEYLEGQTLSELLENNKDLSLHTISYIFEQLCLAIKEAHDAGVVHRDLKPDNIFLIRRGDDPYFVKVIDFGIAKDFASEHATNLTQGVIGTPEYMSPEQCTAQPIDHRSDIYSMGTILYEMVVGFTPYLPPNLTQNVDLMYLVFSQLSTPPNPPSQAASDKEIPDALEQLILKALAKKPEERQQTVDELLRELKAFQQTHLGLITSNRHTLDITPMPTQEASTSTSQPVVETPKPRPLPTADPVLPAPIPVTPKPPTPITPSFEEDAPVTKPPSSKGLFYGTIGAFVIFLLAGTYALFGTRAQTIPPTKQRQRKIAKRPTKPPVRERLEPRVPAPQRPSLPRVAARPVRRVTKRKRRRRRRRTRMIVLKRRTKSKTNIEISQKARTPGCPMDPKGGKWFRINASPSGLELKAVGGRALRTGGHHCVLRKGTRRVRVVVTGLNIQECLFLLPTHKRVIRIRLKKSTGLGGGLDENQNYCL